MYEIYQKLLDKNGLKNADISRATGISNMTLSDWKRGKTTPKQDKLQLIADYFGVTLDYLVNGEEKLEAPSEEAELLKLVRHDKALMAALEKYFSMTEEKKKHILNTIDVLSEVKK